MLTDRRLQRSGTCTASWPRCVSNAAPCLLQCVCSLHRFASCVCTSSYPCGGHHVSGNEGKHKGETHKRPVSKPAISQNCVPVSALFFHMAWLTSAYRALLYFSARTAYMYLPCFLIWHGQHQLIGGCFIFMFGGANRCFLALNCSSEQMRSLRMDRAL